METYLELLIIGIVGGGLLIGLIAFLIFQLISSGSRESLIERIQGLENQLRETLDLSKASVDQSLKEAASDTSKSLQELQNSLGQIKGHQGQINQLVSKFEDLHQVLVSTKKQGKFGETVMEDIVRDVLPNGQYEFQTAISNGSRPDVLIKYPKPHPPLCIDSKFPATSYRKIIESEGDVELETARKEFATAMKKHIKDVASKYIVPGETSKFALMFVPSEAIFVDLQLEHADLVQYAIERRVYFVSPNTMMAVVHSIASIHQDMRVVREVDAIIKNVEKLEAAVNQVHKSANSALNQFDRSHASLKDVVARAETAKETSSKIRELGADVQRDEPQPIPIDEVKQIRSQ